MDNSFWGEHFKVKDWQAILVIVGLNFAVYDLGFLWTYTTYTNWAYPNLWFVSGLIAMSMAMVVILIASCIFLSEELPL